MKFIFMLAIFVACASQLYKIEAIYIRQSRSLVRESCSENLSVPECKTYAIRQLAKKKVCRAFEIEERTIIWQYCGSAFCINAKIIPENISKPFPECCQTCERI